jgi:hypothetical protein
MRFGRILPIPTHSQSHLRSGPAKSSGELYATADISVTHPLELAHRTRSFTFGDAKRNDIARTSGREAYKRAVETCRAT